MLKKSTLYFCAIFLAFTLLSSLISCKNKPSGWHHQSIIYHIWVKSFADSDDRDTIGDIRGIISKLDYLNDGNPESDTDLGVNTILLSPIFDCELKSTDPNLNMHGYDVIDYYKVNPLFGSLDDVKTLLKEAHKRGIKVLFDFAPNHTSTAHPWFIDSANNGEKRDWYIWKEEPDQAWKSPWGGGHWTNVWKFKNDSYYYTTFNVPNFADLNFKNDDVKEELNNVVKYWLELGFDGMRLDAARHLVEESPDSVLDTEKTLDFSKDLRSVLDDFSEHKAMIAEAWEDRDIITRYTGNGDNMFHMAFDFEFPVAVQAALKYKDKESLHSILKFESENFPGNSRPVTFLCNHDIGLSRPYSTFSGNLNKSLQAATLNILSPGVPSIFYGNEIGMAGIASRDANMRKFLNWKDVEKQLKSPDSLLSWYKYLIKIKKLYKSLSYGKYIPLKSKYNELFAYARQYDDETILVILNISNAPTNISIDLKDLKLPEESKISELIGSFLKKEKSSIHNIRLQGLPANGVEILYLGKKSQKQIFTHSKKIIGGSKEKEIAAVKYNKMFLRGTMNGWTDESPMKKISDHLWQVDIDLFPLPYEFKFETSGKQLWEVNWGVKTGVKFKPLNNRKVEKDGINLKIKPRTYGKYRFIFNDKEETYNIKLLKKIK